MEPVVVCEACWVMRSGDSLPVRVRDDARKPCVVCGESTESGIYVLDWEVPLLKRSLAMSTDAVVAAEAHVQTVMKETSKPFTVTDAIRYKDGFYAGATWAMRRRSEP